MLRIKRMKEKRKDTTEKLRDLECEKLCLKKINSVFYLSKLKNLCTFTKRNHASASMAIFQHWLKRTSLYFHACMYLWLQSDSDPPERIFLIDLPFTVVDQICEHVDVIEHPVFVSQPPKVFTAVLKFRHQKTEANFVLIFVNPFL